MGSVEDILHNAWGFSSHNLCGHSLNNTVTVKTVKGRGRCGEYEIRISEEDLENLLIDNGVDPEVIDEIMDDVK